MKLSLFEISDWQEFENLVADYFRMVKDDDGNDVFDVEVKLSGTGADGGRDILLTILVRDSVVTFKRRWVVQCKFYSRSVSKSHISDVNIPSLIHEYKADGYLLICKTTAQSELTRSFELLSQNCKFGYRYEIWTGDEFGLKVFDIKPLVEKYFPDFYYNYFPNIKS